MPTTAAVVSASEVNRQTSRPYSRRRNKLKKPTRDEYDDGAREGRTLFLSQYRLSTLEHVVYNIIRRIQPQACETLPTYRFCEYSLGQRPSADPVDVSRSPLSISPRSCPRRKRFCEHINRQFHQISSFRVYPGAPGLPYAMITISYSVYTLRDTRSRLLFNSFGKSLSYETIILLNSSTRTAAAHILYAHNFLFLISCFRTI